jgi:hypothetical protein
MNFYCVSQIIMNVVDDWRIQVMVDTMDLSRSSFRTGLQSKIRPNPNNHMG